MTNFYKDKKQINNWLDEHQVKNYTLIPDEKYGFVVDVDGDVNLNSKKLINILVKFNEVNGAFLCYNNKLTSLEFCPKKVGGNFSCSNNQLTSLKFCPEKMGGNFLCSRNKLTSLEFCPQKVGLKFYCSNNKELKEIQEINDFNLIYLEHKKTLAIKLAEALESQLPDNDKKMSNIKI